VSWLTGRYFSLGPPVSSNNIIYTLWNILHKVKPSMSNFKEPHILLRVKEYSSNQSYLINILYLLHSDLYLKLMYPWIQITRVQNNEVFCIINIICKCIRISLLSWLHSFSILIHDGCHIWTRGYWHLRITWLRSLCPSLWGPIVCDICLSFSYNCCSFMYLHFTF
jgi:hypothetical protein